MDEQTKQRLVTELRDYLDALPETPEDASSDDENGDSREVDLYTLFTELAGVRNEIRLESRQLKRALDEFGSVFSTLEDNSKRLQSELDARRNSQATTTADAERALLLDLIELRDRLAQSHELASGHQPGALTRLFSRRQHALIRDMAEGLGITLRRLDQTLARYAVAPIQAIGQTIDPHRMRVAAVRSETNYADGVALEEIRRGYQRADEVLRLAEVVANNTRTTNSDEIEQNI